MKDSLIQNMKYVHQTNEPTTSLFLWHAVRSFAALADIALLLTFSARCRHRACTKQRCCAWQLACFCTLPLKRTRPTFGAFGEATRTHTHTHTHQTHTNTHASAADLLFEVWGQFCDDVHVAAHAYPNTCGCNRIWCAESIVSTATAQAQCHDVCRMQQQTGPLALRVVSSYDGYEGGASNGRPLYVILLSGVAVRAFTLP
jgi:hypothetical protein